MAAKQGRRIRYATARQTAFWHDEVAHGLRAGARSLRERYGESVTAVLFDTHAEACEQAAMALRLVATQNENFMRTVRKATKPRAARKAAKGTP